MTDPSHEESPLEELRKQPANPHGFGGFGPLIALGVLVLLMVLLAPTIAPEHVVLVPSDDPVSTTTVATSTTTTTPTTATTVGP